jgi:hypothetical protein
MLLPLMADVLRMVFLLERSRENASALVVFLGGFTAESPTNEHLQQLGLHIQSQQYWYGVPRGPL